MRMLLVGLVGVSAVAACSVVNAPDDVQGTTGVGGGTGAAGGTAGSPGCGGSGAADDLCGEACVDTRTDTSHCGVCDNECPADWYCVDGQCSLECPEPLTDCYGECVDTTAHPDHCSGCGLGCDAATNAHPICVASQCDLECDGGYGDCDADEGCETNTNEDPLHCGQCNDPCGTVDHGTPTCSGGECVVETCEQDYGDCDGQFANGCEAELLVDMAHCGACNDPCTSPEVCQGGQCVEPCPATVPNFSGEQGPDFTADCWRQCEGYLDVSGGDEVPAAWGDDCMGAQYTQIRVVCGAGLNQYRYIDVDKNVFELGLASYPENNLIIDARDQNGATFSYPDNAIYATGNHPHNAQSWWAGGNGCGETNGNLTVNNSCTWEASNCFGQNLSGSRYLWVYVHE